jgi:hypothetical protein
MYFGDMPSRRDDEDTDPSGYYPRSIPFDYSDRFKLADGHIYASFLRRGSKHKATTLEKMSNAHKALYDAGRVAPWKGVTGAHHPLYGFTHSDATKQLISEKAKARPRKPLSEETRRKISARLTGIKRSLETRRKVSDANRRRYANPSA